MPNTSKPTFYTTLTAAVADFAANGYDSEERLVHWVQQLRAAAEENLIPKRQLETMLRQNLGAVYKRLVDKEGLLKQNPGVHRFTLEKVKPALRKELDQRILASANLIVLNREASIQKTLQRFSGWATSIPQGGSAMVNKGGTKDGIRKALASLPFEDRRVLVDQGHKLTSALSSILATEGGALAGEWRSNWRQANYDYRPDHKERDRVVYLVRGNWAQAKGLLRAANGYTDEITQAGEEVFCRCTMRWLYNIRDFEPSRITEKAKNRDILTNKGAEALAEVRRKLAA